MKKLVADRSGSEIKYVISEDGEPYAYGVYSIDDANAGDVIAAVCRENSRSTGGFFADGGLKRTDFIGGQCGVLKPGDYFPAAVLTGPRGQKGRLLSREISFCGFYVFVKFVPATAGLKPSVSVSKKIADKEAAEKLKSAVLDFVKDFDSCYSPEITVRTAAEGNEKKTLGELAVFMERFREIAGKIRKREFLKPGAILFKKSFPDYIVSAYRDNSFAEVLTGDASLSLEIMNRFKDGPSVPEIRTVSGSFSVFDVDEGASKLPRYTGRNFYTGSGARITYDETEAMHVFDVNSGGSGKTAAEVNLEACREIARFVSVRNIAGIIMIDFIGMKDQKSRDNVVEEMRLLAKKDYQKFEIYGFTKLEILECSRSRRIK